MNSILQYLSHINLFLECLFSNEFDEDLRGGAPGNSLAIEIRELMSIRALRIQQDGPSASLAAWFFFNTLPVRYKKI